MWRRILIFPFVMFIKIYQWILSPFLGSNCRFQPTCSHYALEAFKTHGVFQGFYLSVIRISKCHPWGKSGYDPVPPPKKHSETN
ncbi:membrane protein insertion efficiency factor YidD [Psychroflexus sediminis]|uniref:membrane protein insertion efficiency factor YidD n=1 Tax=Psychroflexus sediminis TaxID=470826 RepID=UPI000B8141A3|nr:membrane protein insertion efficiency factor YidD [Psychroflexus sediminis]